MFTEYRVLADGCGCHDVHRCVSTCFPGHGWANVTLNKAAARYEKKCTPYYVPWWLALRSLNTRRSDRTHTLCDCCCAVVLSKSVVGLFVLFLVCVSDRGKQQNSYCTLLLYSTAVNCFSFKRKRRQYSVYLWSFAAKAKVQ